MKRLAEIHLRYSDVAGWDNELQNATNETWQQSRLGL